MGLESNRRMRKSPLLSAVLALRGDIMHNESLNHRDMAHLNQVGLGIYADWMVDSLFQMYLKY